MKRRPKTHLTDEQKKIIKQAYSESFLGAKLLRYHIKTEYKQDIPQNKIHAYLLESGLAKQDPNKQKKRKRCRYERDFSLSLIHADWWEYDGKHVIAYEDDAETLRKFHQNNHQGKFSQSGNSTMQPLKTQLKF